MSNATYQWFFRGLIVGCWFAAGLVDFPFVRAADRLNVILIMADDLNNELGCYGSDRVRSPQLDHLAARAMVFDRAYCQYPVCNPSRTALLSGRRPESSGIVDNATPPRSKMPDVVFLPQHFRQNGYRTLKVGKIFHTGPEFEDPASWDVDVRETRESKNPPPETILRRLPGDCIVLNADDSATWDGFVARRGVELLEEAATNAQPFFLAIGFRRPHTPYIAPRRYYDLYPTSDIPARISEPAEHLAKIPPLALTYLRGGKRLEPELRPTVAGAYYACVTFVDTQIRLILDALDRHQLWQNTIVVFASDHGYHLGEHGGLWHKNTLFEESARVPLIVAAPGKPARARCRRLVELVDLYPTLVELCGLPEPAGLEGRSFAALLDAPDRPWKQAAFTVVSRSATDPSNRLDPAVLGRSIRTERWRYTKWPDGAAELYDQDNDPHAYRNLAEDPEHRELVEQLGAQLQAGWKETAAQ